MNFTLKQLETFVWLATLGNYRKTAEQLNTTQPAISSRILGLEEMLNVKLFERDTGSVRLTSKGQELLAYAEKTMKMSAQIYEHSNSKLNFSGLLRLGVSETIVHTKLPKILSALHNEYPMIDVEITVDVSVNLRNELLNRNLDLAFLMGPISEYRIENFNLSSFPLIWAASPKLNINVCDPLTITELTSYPLLTYARNTRPYAEIENFLRNNCEFPVRIFPSSSLAACLQMTIDSIGIGTLPKVLAERYIKSKLLMEIPCQWTPSELNFTASFPSFPSNPIVENAARLARKISQA